MLSSAYTKVEEAIRHIREGGLVIPWECVGHGEFEAPLGLVERNRRLGAAIFGDHHLHALPRHANGVEHLEGTPVASEKR